MWLAFKQALCGQDVFSLWLCKNYFLMYLPLNLDFLFSPMQLIFSLLKSSEKDGEAYSWFYFSLCICYFALEHFKGKKHWHGWHYCLEFQFPFNRHLWCSDHEPHIIRCMFRHSGAVSDGSQRSLQWFQIVVGALWEEGQGTSADWRDAQLHMDRIGLLSEWVIPSL